MSECVPQSAPSLMGSRFYLIHGSRSPIESTLKRQRHSDPSSRYAGFAVVTSTQTDRPRETDTNRPRLRRQPVVRKIGLVHVYTTYCKRPVYRWSWSTATCWQTATHNVYRDQQIQKKLFYVLLFKQFTVCAICLCLFCVFLWLCSPPFALPCINKLTDWLIDWLKYCSHVWVIS